MKKNLPQKGETVYSTNGYGLCTVVFVGEDFSRVKTQATKGCPSHSFLIQTEAFAENEDGGFSF